MIWSTGCDVACPPAVPIPQNHLMLTRVSAFIHELPGKNGRFICICNTCSRLDTVQQHTDVVFEPLLGVGMVQKEHHVPFRIFCTGPSVVLADSSQLIPVVDKRENESDPPLLAFGNHPVKVAKCRFTVGSRFCLDYVFTGVLPTVSAVISIVEGPHPDNRYACIFEGVKCPVHYARIEFLIIGEIIGVGACKSERAAVEIEAPVPGGDKALFHNPVAVGEGRGWVAVTHLFPGKSR